MELLTINKKDANADDNQGPSVESENREERIEARRTRIKKKNEMNQKKKLGIKSAVETEKKKELSKSRKQIHDSRARLVKLDKDGLELVNLRNLLKIFRLFRLFRPKKNGWKCFRFMIREAILIYILSKY